MREIALPLLFLALSAPLFARTTTTYQASTGTVSSYNAVTGNFIGVYSSNQTTYATFPSGYSYPSMLVTDPTVHMVPDAYVGEDININRRSYPIKSNNATSVTIMFWTGGAVPANGTPFTINKGGFKSPNGMGGGCYFGGCPAWPFANYPFSYALPNGTTASFTNFTGTANFTNQFDVIVQGTASGVDSTGASVSVVIEFEWGAFCRSGRGGGCTKTFHTGTVTITE
jgi:hypothetical protein